MTWNYSVLLLYSFDVHGHFPSCVCFACAALGNPSSTLPRCKATPLHEQRRNETLRVRTAFESRVFGFVAIAKSIDIRCCGAAFGNVALGPMALGLNDSAWRARVPMQCRTKLRPGPKASAPTRHCCHHLRAYGFPAGIVDCLERKWPRARNACVLLRPCPRPRDSIAKRSRIYVISLVTDPHTKFCASG